MAITPGPYIVGEPGGPSGPFYSIVNQQGNVVAMQVMKWDDAVLWTAALDLLAAVKAAEQLATFARDFGLLYEVEIDGEVVDIYDLRDKFTDAILKAQK